MKKNKAKRNRIDYKALEMVRVYTMEQIVKMLNDSTCNMSSCEIRKYVLDAIDV